VNKNNLLIRNVLSKTNIAVFCAVGMVFGFLMSRAWLSFFVFAFGVNSLWNVHPKNWKKDTWWILSAAFFLMYAVSYFWTLNIESWQTRVEVKLPIILLPLAFTFLPSFNRKHIQFFVVCSALLLLGSIGYSLSFFIKDPAYYSEQYVYSHMLPTPVYGDHCF
jgi:O-antigen ligase